MGASEGSPCATTSLDRMTDAPASASRAVAPFAFLGSEHPMAPRIARFRAAIAERAPHVTAAATVHADLTLRPDGDGGLVLHRAYWSLQAEGPDGFRATTLSYHATATGRRGWSSPRTPSCRGWRAWTDRPYRGVLRYMPLRRCTILSEIVRRTATPMIVKFKRPHRAAESWALLKAVHATFGRRARGLRRAAPARAGPAGRVLRPDRGPGEDLAGPGRRRRGPDLLRRAGALHRAMHAAAVAGVAAGTRPGAGRRCATTRAGSRSPARARGRRRATVAALARRAPAPPARPPSATATSCPRSCSSTATASPSRTSTAPGPATPTATSPSGSRRSRSTCRRWTVRSRPATRRRSNAPRPRTSTATGRTTSAACSGTVRRPRSTTSRSRSRRTATSRPARSAACGSRSSARRRST